MCGGSDRTPVLRVEFRDAECAASWSSAVTAALRSVSGLRRVQAVAGTPLLLQAWDCEEAEADSEEWPLFVEDSKPATLDRIEVPTYAKPKFDMLDKNGIATENKPPKPVPGTHRCFNCDDFHNLRDCPHPKNFQKINQNKKDMRAKFVRYHMDEQVRVENKLPGKISRSLRRALGLSRFQLPMHIYRMRQFGYPPGWLSHARVSHSGLALFDSHGNEVKDSENDGVHPEFKDRYDIKKIMSFPGFNTIPSSKYIDESRELGYPPLNKEHSKMLMLERLAPIAAKAYRRKKITSNKMKNNPGDEQEHEDMDIDDESDEYGEDDFSESFVPPLPPPIQLPHPPPIDLPPLPPPPLTELPPLPPPSLNESPLLPTGENSSIINTDDINTDSVNSPNVEADIDRSSPTLDDLEKQQLALKAALEEKDLSSIDNCDTELVDSNSANDSISSFDLNKSNNLNKSGMVRDSDLGTPIFNLSSFSELPGSNSFSKDISDVMNFENLPNSTGKYIQMSGLIKKVREAVIRIQESDL